MIARARPGMPPAAAHARGHEVPPSQRRIMCSKVLGQGRSVATTSTPSFLVGLTFPQNPCSSRDCFQIGPLVCLLFPYRTFSADARTTRLGLRSLLESQLAQTMSHDGVNMQVSWQPRDCCRVLNAECWACDGLGLPTSAAGFRS